MAYILKTKDKRAKQWKNFAKHTKKSAADKQADKFRKLGITVKVAKIDARKSLYDKMRWES